MKLVKIKSKQKDITVKSNGDPAFQLHFQEQPLEVMESIAKKLVQSDNFEIVGEGKEVEEKEVSIEALDDKSKERVKDFVEDLKDDGKRNRSNKKKKEGENK